MITHKGTENIVCGFPEFKSAKTHPQYRAGTQACLSHSQSTSAALVHL